MLYLVFGKQNTVAYEATFWQSSTLSEPCAPRKQPREATSNLACYKIPQTTKTNLPLHVLRSSSPIPESFLCILKPYLFLSASRHCSAMTLPMLISPINYLLNCLVYPVFNIFNYYKFSRKLR